MAAVRVVAAMRVAAAAWVVVEGRVVVAWAVMWSESADSKHQQTPAFAACHLGQDLPGW